MPKKSFSITGFEIISEALKGLEPKLQKRVISQAIRKGLVPIRNEAKRLALEGEHATGFTAKAIKIRVKPKKKRHIIALEVRVGDGDYKGKTFYAAMVEFGTRHMEAHPFMRPALDQKKNESINLVKHLIIQGIDRVVKD